MTNIIEDGKPDRNGVWHKNGRLRNVKLDYSKLCKGVKIEENYKSPDQVVIVERVELDQPIIRRPKIIEINLELESAKTEEKIEEKSEKKPAESMPTTTSTEKPPENGKRVNRFYVKDDRDKLEKFVRSLNNFADLEKAFNYLMELKKYADELNSHLVKFNQPIFVENGVDQEPPPKFIYTNEYDLSMLDKSVRDQIDDGVQKCKWPLFDLEFRW